MCSSVRRFDLSDLVNISSSWMADKYPSTCDEKDDISTTDVLHFRLLDCYLHDLEISNRVVIS